MGKEKNSWAMFVIIILAAVYSAYIVTDKALLIMLLASMIKWSETIRLVFMSFPRFVQIIQFGLLIIFVPVFYYAYKRLAMKVVGVMRKKRIS